MGVELKPKHKPQLRNTQPDIGKSVCMKASAWRYHIDAQKALDSRASQI